MRPLDRQSLGGDLILQDHRDDVDPHLRATIKACRVIARHKERPAGYEIEGKGEDVSPEGVLGTIRGAFWNGAAQDHPEKPEGVFAFAGAVVLTEASKRPRPSGGSSLNSYSSTSTRTRTPAPGPVGPRLAKVRMVRDGRWAGDERLAEVEAMVHPDAPDLPAGSPAVLLAGTEDGSQELLLLPVSPGTLRAVNRGPDPEASSIVYDQDAAGKDDPTWQAPLHKLVRVARLGPRCNGPRTTALAWQLTNPTRGLIVDTPAAPLRPPTPADVAREVDVVWNEGLGQLEWVLRGESKGSSWAYWEEDRSPAYAGRTSVGGTMVRPPAGGSTQAINSAGSTTARPPTTLQAPLVYALTSAQAGGPLDVGSTNDTHRVGTTEDGCPINAAHIQTGALFRGGPGDGPLDFEFTLAEDVSSFPHRAAAHIRWNPRKTHTGPCGESYEGVWDVQVESPMFTPEDRLPPTPPGVIGIPGVTGGPGGGGKGGGGSGGGGSGGSGGGPGGRPVDTGWAGMPYGPRGDGGLPVAECHTVPSAGEGAPEGIHKDGTEGLPSGASGSTPSAWAGPAGAGLAGGALGPIFGGQPAPSSPDGAAPAGGAAGAAVGPRQDQKGGSRWAALENHLGIPLGSIDGGGNVRLPGAQIEQLQLEGVLDSRGRVADSYAQIGDSVFRRLQVMGGVFTRTPTVAGTIAATGGLALLATPWAKGEIDTGAGGFVDDEAEAKIARSPLTFGLVGWSPGTGRLDGIGTGTRYGGLPTSALPMATVVPGELANGEGLALIMGGAFSSGGRLDGAREPLTVAFAEGVSQLFLGQQDPETGVGTGVLVSSGDGGTVTLQAYTDGAAATEAVVITPGGGVEITGSLTNNGGSVGGSGSAAIGGSGEDGAVSLAANTEIGAQVNATTWSLGASYEAYPGGNKNLVIKATGAFTLNGTLGGDARSWIEP